MNSLLSTTIVLAIATGSALAQAPATPAPAQAAQPSNEWPQKTQVDGVSYTLNQPSFTGLTSNTVTMRSVAQVSGNGSDKSGTVTMTASIAASDVAGLVEVSGFSVTGTDGSIDSAAGTAIQNQLKGMAFTIPLSTLVQDISVDAARNETGLSNAAPDIVVTGEAAVLVSVAGNPALSPVGGTGWKRVTNTPFMLLQSQDGSWWVRLGTSTWMTAKGMTDRYAPATSAPPQAVIDALGKMPATPGDLQQDIERVGSRPATPPAVLVVTRPTVLVSIQGAMKLRQVAAGIQEVTNANQTMLVRDASPRNWVLAAGRWFCCDTLTGPWKFVPPAELPKDFAKIQASGLRITSALASVPGTRQAKEAAVNTGLVRTIVLDRSKATCDVTWHGEPNFQPIQGTKMAYATNASQPVIQLGGSFYCCDSAAWFTATAAKGPWTLCDSVPADIYTIPASCPVYPCTFVEIYGSSKDSVTFGFTSGYMGSYMQDGAAVFGTGYDYAGSTNPDGSSQTYPQTYGSQASYDEDTGTWAPPAYDDYSDYYPALYPDVYTGGWGGWGWYGGYGAAYGWGYGNWNRWNNWNNYYNHWHPYYNHWNPAWNNDHRLYQNRWNQANRDANRAGTANTFNRSGTWNAYDASRAEANRWNRANGVVQVNPNREEAREQRQVLGPNREADARRDFGYHPSGFHPSYQGGGHAAPARGGGGGRR
jgi:hypothetical protein